MVQGQRAKGQGHSVHNSQHIFTSNMSRFVTYLPRECVEHLPTTLVRIAHSGWIGSTWRLPGALRKTSVNNIFKPNKPEKHRTSGAKSELPSRCNAFAIARFLVCFCTPFLAIDPTRCSQLDTNLANFKVTVYVGQILEFLSVSTQW